MPCRFSLFLFLDRRMPDIASMVASTAQIAMADFMKRMSGFPPPMSYRLPSVHPASQAVLAGTAAL